MTVEIKYVVVRNGEEKMTFISKKEADAYDKMLDMADELSSLLQRSPIQLEEAQNEELALYLAQQREQLALILRGGKLDEEVAEKPTKARRPRKDKAAEDTQD